MKIFFIIVALLATTALYAQPSINKAAPEIGLKDPDGKLQRLSDLKGKVVLIDFWASWCGPCRRAMPALKAVYDQYQAKGFEIYGISIDEDQNAWKKAVAADQLNWIHVSEPGGWNGKTALAWNIESIPSSFLLNKEGQVIAKNPTPEQLQGYLQKLVR